MTASEFRVPEKRFRRFPGNPSVYSLAMKPLLGRNLVRCDVHFQGTKILCDEIGADTSEPDAYFAAVDDV
ncbi:hypothetical protein ABIF38_000307 [Bradyrhizobium japonicum]|nr:hypothetical protein [Bradyrhizobium elkanii]MCP1737628.1 hypothetical protein [Bradyrhizobium elkanii]MCS3576185.1 hypothetical protein [Bradyrhizobium elkanii]MCS3594480.1 hypothetical protein [Bradyrhizobium elkanii]MCS3626069.1 hypothetical protein [Bradyrhizobium elkanii]